ncbi:MAG: cupin domain-containing protein [Acidobacteria bacterium]|nr:cupin domain-containing protein [Acidobacteriota bacterium]
MSARDQVRHIRWEAMEKERLSDRIGRRIITADRAMLTHVYLDKGAVVPMHSHDNEQLTYVISGALRFWIEDEDSEPIDVKAGEVLVLPSWVPHKAIALEDTLDVDIFTPPRQDWLDGTDDYLRGGGD